jgi:hypothetical protein
MIVEIDQEPDHKKMYFDSNTEFIPINQDTCVKACVRAHSVYNYCTFSLCQKCYDEKMTELGHDGKPKRRKRSAESKNGKKVEGSVTPQSILSNRCHHELHHLTDLDRLHHCAPEKAGKQVWFTRPSGCRNCEKMYVYFTGVGNIKATQKVPNNHWQNVENNMDDYTRSKYNQWRNASNELNYD